jgi:CheY-like chemotaxis protein
MPFLRNARVLVLDDDPQWVETIEGVLKSQVGYIASANSLEAACELLDKYYFNVAIIDMSLQLGNDKDRGGIEFLNHLQKHHEAETVRPIILSAYGTTKLIREAFRNYPIVDFLEKEVDMVRKNRFNAEELLQNVRNALSRNHLDREVQIEISRNQHLRDLLANFDWGATNSNQDSSAVEQLEAELYDLLRRLFPKANRLFLTPMKAGQSGAGVLEVEPVNGLQVGELVVVKFGLKEKIWQEHLNFQEYIAGYVGAYSSTQLDSVLGRAMGAIRYSLVGTELGALNNFTNFYTRHDVKSICAAVDNIFDVTCGRWYDNHEQPKQRRNVVNLYETGLNIKREGKDEWPQIWAAAEATGVTLSRDEIQFPGLIGSFTNPKHWLEAQDYQIYHSVWRATTHGDLNPQNILLTEDGRCWLIDFYRTGVGHILRDVVELESSIKFQLTDIDSLTDYQRMEALLLSQERIDQPVDCDPTDPYFKPLTTIGYLRSRADKFTGAAKDMYEYNLALLLQTLGMLRLNFIQEKHPALLLSAAMLCDWLTEIS